MGFMALSLRKALVVAGIKNLSLPVLFGWVVVAPAIESQQVGAALPQSSRSAADAIHSTAVSTADVGAQFATAHGSEQECCRRANSYTNQQKCQGGACSASA